MTTGKGTLTNGHFDFGIDGNCSENNFFYNIKKGTIVKAKLFNLLFINIIIFTLSVFAQNETQIKITKDIQFIGKPENLGRNVNSIYPENVPIISPDGKTLFFALKNHPENIGGLNTGYDIWLSKLGIDGKWQTAYNIGKPLNTESHNFVCSISPDGNTLLLGNTYGHGEGVSISHKTKDGWSFPEKLIIDSFYNRGGHVSCFLANDNKTLLMAVQRDDSYGEQDIYVSFLEDDDSWSEPMNLGKTVNTSSVDGCPFLASDSKTLFFSSNGYPGYGGRDIYMTKRLDDSWQKWSEPENLGNQINSAKSEIYFTIPSSGDYAYFSSDENSYGESDIFRIKMKTKANNVLIYGKVFNKKTNKPITDKTVIIRYERLSDGKEVGMARTNPANGEYKITLPHGELYAFRGESVGYWGISENMDLRADSLRNYNEIEKNLSLSPYDTLKVNVFFDLNLSELRQESFPDLNRAAKLINDNPRWNVKVEGHTCDRGTTPFNKKLSKDRAKSVEDYLTREGIDIKRINSEGYGESKRICLDTLEVCREKNRRVEIIIDKK
ncbi:MAG: OmpA family protein [bacterium]